MIAFETNKKEEIISAKLVSPEDPAAQEKARVSKFKDYLQNHS